MEGDVFSPLSRPRQLAMPVKGGENHVVVYPVGVFTTDYMFVLTINCKSNLLSVTMSFIVPPTALLFSVPFICSHTQHIFFSGFISSVINSNLKVWLHRQAGEIRTDGCLYHIIFPQFYQPELWNEGTSGRLRFEPRGTHVLFSAQLAVGILQSYFY